MADGDDTRVSICSGWSLVLGPADSDGAQLQGGELPLRSGEGPDSG